MKKTIKDIKLQGKKVLVRVDFNVPLKDGVVKDDNRVKEAIPTIKYLISQGAKVVLCSHLGKVDHKDPVKCEENKAKNDMKFVVPTLENLLNQHVYYVDEVCGEKVDSTLDNLKDGEVMLLQNTRYEKGESKNDETLAKNMAKNIDVFVMDAFGSAHRAHSSTYGVAEILNDSGKETAIGFLMEKEIDALTKCVEANEHPYVAVLGGAKVSDKINVIEGLLTKADKIIIGGAMAYTFLKAKGVEVGKSLVENDQLEFAKNCLDKANGKIILPIDHIVSFDIDSDESMPTINENIPELFLGFDIGPKTRAYFDSELKNSKIVFWNGPMGVFEKELYAEGTRKICESIAKLDNCFSVIGGGDSASAAKQLGFKEKFSHVSTGGGASLEMIENDGKLPGIEIIQDK
jgi:phosphoglycerate kinase